MAVDFKTFNIVAPLIADAKYPVLLRGRHGIGKSCVVYQFAETVGLPVVERRASQMTEGDLVGLPVIDEVKGTTTFNPPDWFKAACDNAVVLFLDEVDRATPEVRQGIFELTDSRKLNGHVLDEGTMIFAAVNGGEHGAEYQVGEMDPAELDRWTVYDIEPTVEDWLDWGNGKVLPLVWDFINNNRGHLEHKETFEPNKKYPSRRSWDRLSQTVEKAGLWEAEDVDFGLLFNVTAGFVGFEAAVTFVDFAKNYDRQVTVDDLLAGKIEKTEKFAMNEHCALIEKLGASGRITEELTDDELTALGTYFIVLPGEAAMKLWNTVAECDKDATIKLHGVVYDGKKVGDHLTELLVGDVTPAA
ncbi:uncharacterized protein METZ01_LOCUS225712 [marine metagenome]|uniref:ATPase dynein-related AAA domain-containing protein n=1 Tax=marine metagenome TaxID=408172 RepID=A0A382GC92_9ZZZZ